MYVNQSGPVDATMLEDVPELFASQQAFFDQSEYTDEANWKLLAETTMEGYHIRSLHKKSFFPYGLDNITLVENFGVHSRVIFPFKRIEKLRDIEPKDQRLDGMITSVYQLVKDAGFDEDREAACAIQGTLGTQANQHLTFGHFEKAIVHFHKNLAQHLSS